MPLDRWSLHVGDVVKLTDSVMRFPDFEAPKGAEGVVTENEGDLLLVKMVEPIPGAEQWDNEIQFYDDDFEDLPLEVVGP